ncbi:MAG: hypothetical protein J6E46_04515 [Faecalicoccus sp.]|nr:hypothetical protein [Faecalicoccus sp.]
MTNFLITVAASAVLVIILFIIIARRTKLIDKIYFPLFLIVVISGLLIYGYAFTVNETLLFTAVIRTALQVLAMFVGNVNYDIVKNTPLYATLPGQFIFWSVHLLAFYMTASAVLSTIGSTLILKNRGILLKLSRQEVNIIYGTDGNSFNHAKALLKSNPKSLIVFIDDHSTSDYSNFINQLGFVVVDSTNPRFEDNFGLKHKKGIQLYCISPNEQNNMEFAYRFANILKDANSKASLTIRATEKTLDQILQTNSKQYNNIFCFTEKELTARLVTRKASFVDHIHFNDAALAQNDLYIAIVGFSILGQEVFSDTVRNTQFEGCKTHYYIIDKDLDNLAGPYKHENPGLFENYDITMINKDCRSLGAVSVLKDALDQFDVVMICMSNEHDNASLASIWESMTNQRCTIIQCYENEVKIFNDLSEPQALYGSDVLITKTIDDRAMKVNQLYSNDVNIQSAWEKADAFSRQSSRAMADFIDVYKKIMDKVPEVNDEVLENLSRTEHLRWCAFHYTKGYQTMNKNVISQRAAQRNEQIEKQGHSDIRITVDRVNKLHACLIDWDKLDELDQFVYQLTGTQTNYKELDRQNVRNIEHFIN